MNLLPGLRGSFWPHRATLGTRNALAIPTREGLCVSTPPAPGAQPGEDADRHLKGGSSDYGSSPADHLGEVQNEPSLQLRKGRPNPSLQQGDVR